MNAFVFHVCAGRPYTTFVTAHSKLFCPCLPLYCSHQDGGFKHQIRLHTGSLPQVGHTTATWLGANYLPTEKQQDPGAAPGLQLTAAHRQAQGV